MNTSDLLSIFIWWLIWLSLGVVFLPLTALLFRSFFDKGYIFSKILGILLISYTLWLLGSIKLVPFTTLSILVIFGIFLGLNTYFSRKNDWTKLVKPVFKIIILEEIIFTLGLIFWSWVKGFEPSIHGLEKFMDFGFINSILRSEFFPPKDIWLTPFSINYYYFGHLVSAVITKLSGLDPAITYNLTLATLFALTLSASFSIGANLLHLFQTNNNSKKLYAIRSTLFSGFLSAFLVTLGGNIHTIYVFFQSYVPADNPIPFWQLPLKLNIEGYWYPNATRFIQYTIHEFPVYSFVVSDLHGHVLNIPFVLLVIALFIAIFHSKYIQPRLTNLWLILLGLLVATFLMTNVLDGPIYLIGIFLIFFFKNYSLQKEGKRVSLALIETIKTVAIILLFTILFSLPYWLAFKPFASGIGVLCAPQFLTTLGKLGPFLFEPNHCARSPIWMLMILWGFFYFLVFGFGFYLFKQLKSPRSLKLVNNTDHLALTLAIFATILIIIPEFFYAKDIYPAHYRANTVFKFGYQAFIILGLISGYMITRILTLQHKTIRYTLYTIPLLFLFFLVAIYPLFAINSYFGGLKTYQGLNGLKYLAPLYPSDYKAILWLRDNVEGQPVIAEAQGDSYTDFARVSSNTGLPTIIGWPVHEWLWRGSYDEAGKRSTEVTLFYETPSIETAKQLIQRYNIEYIFIGSLERQKYLKLNEQKFQTLGNVVFQDGNTVIYKINSTK